MYATFDAPTNELIAVYGTVSEAQNAPLSVLSTTGFYNTGLGSNFGEFINPAFFSAFPEVEYDSWFTIGTENTNGDGGVGSVGLEPYLEGFNSGNGFTVDTFLGASWFVVPGSNTDAIAGDDNKVLVAQLTTDGVATLVMNFQYDDLEGNSYNTDGLTGRSLKCPLDARMRRHATTMRRRKSTTAPALILEMPVTMEMQ